MLAHDVLAELKSSLQLQPMGEAVGNLSLFRARVTGVDAVVALVENRLASGALGMRESDKLAGLFTVAAAKKTPLLLYMDSAGAKLSEGLPALGAFRRLYKAALALAHANVPFTVFCGANCFGGASMIASLAGTRNFASNTRFAMSGPAILAQAAGSSALDEAFLAMSHAAIGAEARVKLGDGNQAVSADALREPFGYFMSVPARHAALGARIEKARKKATERGTKFERNDVAKLFPDGYLLHEANGVVIGEAKTKGERVAVLGIVDGRALGVVRAWLLAEAIWNLVAKPPKTLHVLVDCDSHATSLDDERAMLSAYLANVASALFALARAGTHIETTVLGKLGGGVYVALAAPSAVVNVLYGKEIQLLPGKAIASILGDVAASSFTIADYQAAGVAEQELKLGIV